MGQMAGRGGGVQRFPKGMAAPVFSRVGESPSMSADLHTLLSYFRVPGKR